MSPTAVVFRDRISYLMRRHPQLLASVSRAIASLGWPRDCRYRRDRDSELVERAMRIRAMLRLQTILASAAIAFVPLTNALADDALPPFDRFADRCLDRGPQYDRAAALAHRNKWPSLAADMVLSILPLSEPVAFDGWITGAGSTAPFEALVVGRAMVGEKAVESCTMAFAGTDAAGFERSLVSTRAARPSGEQNGEGRIRKFFTIERDGLKEAVTLDLPIYPNGSDEVLASVVAEQQTEH
ncbi:MULTISPECIES: hypothetical protein [unclassified Rhizobium]|uniref:hypothetical protein n=1 Tax=unclassified Rhizobium TaxID=2613769 RepID=UPI000A2110AE|nr:MULTISPECIES: hypothetical protein [unclassified Rhizobium]ARO27312.1 hypothetical protein TAL182_PD00220 [Rhizobium sp. TAL182]